MAFRRLFGIFLRRTNPVLLTTSSIFVEPLEKEDTKRKNEKIQWENADPSKLTYENMIKRSTMETVNGVTQTLTITYTAIETASVEYRRCLALLLSLVKESLTYKVPDSHWDLIIAARYEVRKRKEILVQYLSYMDYVQKIGAAATEACYMTGMDNLSITLSQRMDDALNNVNKEIKHNEILETEYTLLQEEAIRKTNIDEASSKDKDGGVEIETILED